MKPTYMRWKYHKDWKERTVNDGVYRNNICQVSSLIKIINVYPRSSMNSKINIKKWQTQISTIKEKGGHDVET